MIDLEQRSFRAVRIGFQRWLAGCVAVATLVSVSAAARAEGEDTKDRRDPSCPCAARVPVTNAPDRPLVDRWYGWETAAFDGAALAMGITMVATHPSSPSPVLLPVFAATTFYAGAPAMHLAHGHVDKALGSLGLRAALPVLTALGGMAVLTAGKADFEDRLGGVTTGMVLGYGVGAVAAAVLDATLIANERVPAPPPRDAGIAITNLTPTVSVLPHGGAVVGLSGLLF
jgi:hypothetical protein